MQQFSQFQANESVPNIVTDEAEGKCIEYLGSNCKIGLSNALQIVN